MRAVNAKAFSVSFHSLYSNEPGMNKSNVASCYCVTLSGYKSYQGPRGLVVKLLLQWHLFQHRWSSQRVPCLHKPAENHQILEVVRKAIWTVENNLLIFKNINQTKWNHMNMRCGIYMGTISALPSWPLASGWAEQRFGRKVVSRMADLSSTVSSAHSCEETELSDQTFFGYFFADILVWGLLETVNRG